MCAQGSPSLPGRNSVNGHNGSPGRNGGMVPKVRKAWQVPVDHVVSKEKRVRRVWQGHLDHVVLKEKRDKLESLLLNKETGNSARGKRMTVHDSSPGDF